MRFITSAVAGRERPGKPRSPEGLQIKRCASADCAVTARITETICKLNYDKRKGENTEGGTKF